MDPQFEELARKVATEVIEQLSPKLVADVSSKVAVEVAHAVETRLEGRMQIHFEQMEGLVKRAAEGYGATLGSIDRRLKRLEKKWDTKITDHDRVLANHNERISSLEHKRR